jgi:hypothetical protein
MITGNLSDWYWFVAGDQANVWSSARAMSVPVDDQQYQDWLAMGYRYTTPIGSMAELRSVLAVQYPPGTLETYAAYLRSNKASGGCTIGGEPYLTDPVSRNTVASAHDYAVANPGHITDWKLADGTFI